MFSYILAMSATNQVQQNDTQFYLDQYDSRTVTWVGYTNNVASPSDTFTSECRFHKQGQLVMVNILGATSNAGATTGLTAYRSGADAIPLDYRSVTTKATNVNTYDATTIKDVAGADFRSDGTIYLFPTGALTFAASARIQGSNVFYFKLG